MEIAYLEEFVAFSRTLHYGKTAKDLFITQPTLSRHIAKMEEELGFPLVVHGKVPRLTREGSDFAVEADNMVRTYHAAVDRMRAQYRENMGKVKIADVRTSYRIERDVSTLEAEGFTCEYINMNNKVDYSGAQVLDEGMVDIEFFWTPGGSTDFLEDMDPRAYTFVPVGRFTPLIALKKGNPASVQGGITIANLSMLTIIMVSAKRLESGEAAFQAKLEQSGLPFQFINGSFDSKFGLIAKDNRYAGSIWETAAERMYFIFDGVEFAPVTDYDMSLQIWAACRKDNPNPAVHDFMRAWESLVEQRESR